jgi:methionine-rich copper-binding protein CopC
MKGSRETSGREKKHQLRWALKQVVSDVRWVAIVVLALFSPSAVSAHAYLVKSVPARRAVLFNAPAKIQLWFNERLESSFSHVTVTDADNKRVDLGNVEIGSDDAKRLSVGLGTLQPGPYKIKFRVLSVDGHVVEDEFPFTVRKIQRAP